MKKILSLLALTLALSACVTINIYFPAAAAEKAADKIIDEAGELPELFISELSNEQIKEMAKASMVEDD